jgi:predicted permease
MGENNIFLKVLRITMGVPALFFEFFNRPSWEVKRILLVIFGVIVFVVYILWFVVWQ